MKDNSWIWWLAIIFGFCTFTPLGVVLLFLYWGTKDKQKKADRRHQLEQDLSHIHASADAAVNSASGAVKSASAAVDDAMREISDAINSALKQSNPVSDSRAKYEYHYSYRSPTYTAPPRPAPHVAKPADPVKKPQKAEKKSAPRTGSARLQMILGGVLAGAFSLGALDELFSELAHFTSIFHLLGETVPLVVFSAIAAFFGIRGYQKLQKNKRFHRLKTLLDTQTGTVSVSALADAMDLRYTRVCDDLQEMIDRGYFSFGYLDRSKGLLVLSPEFLHLTAEAAEAVTEEAERSAPSLDTDSEMLRRIRAANDAIPDPEITAKIDRIEELTRTIFRLIEERPEKADSLHSFTAYYLPQTLKIMEAYARMEQQGVEGANIAAAKEKISHALDLLADGYRQQIDQLFADDVVDITADIAVMEQMLARDGLKEPELTPEKSK